jgi:tripartite-type tricarboxylate transporter receptor subunit TctC
MTRRLPKCLSAVAFTALAMPALVLSSVANAATDYPNKVIRLVVPFAPGGVTDTSGRIVAEGLSKELGQQVVVENRAGASGNVGAAAVAGSAADGYTLLLALDGTLVINPFLYEKPGFDALKDFAPIAKVGDSAILIVTNPKTGIKTLAELIELSKKTPGGLSYGTSGIGSITHIAGELLNRQTGANLVHVPYKGGGPAVTDVLGGHIPLAFGSAASVRQQLQSGALIPIAVPSLQRSAALPAVPTFKESGVDGVALDSWVGVFAPANTPADIIAKLNVATNKVLRDPQVKERLLAAGIVAANQTPEAFNKAIQADAALYEKIIKEANIKLQ